VLSLEQARALLKHFKVEESLVRQALHEQYKSYVYKPERDTALVRTIVAQHSGPPPGTAEDDPF
jgi:hypothetical protein